MFGSSRKLGQTEFIFRVDCKIPCLTQNSFLGFILPSNDFHPRKIEERERETARRLHQKHVSSHQHRPQPQITPLERERLITWTWSRWHRRLGRASLITDRQPSSIHPSLITDPQTRKTHLSDLEGDVLLAWVCCRGSWLSLVGVHLPWVVTFACLRSVVAFDCRSLLPWVELEFRWCVVLFRWWV